MFFASSKILVLATLLLPTSSFGQTIVDVISRDIRFSTFVSLLTAADLTTDLRGPGPLTLFAPFNIGWVNSLVNVTRLLQPAWNAHLTNLLLHQTANQEIWASDLALGDQVIMLSGEVIHVTQANPYDLILNYNATVTEPDKSASNGVVQAMNGVLLPVSASECIYEYAVNNPDTFSVLADLIVRADLVGVLCGPGPSTFFAPDNTAFEALKNDNWDTFVNDQQKVRNLLLYHLLDGNVFASDLKNLNVVQSVQGSEIQVSSTSTAYTTKQEAYAIFLNQASEVIYPDVLVENGVWHTIDIVLQPPVVEDPTIADLLEDEGLTVFVSAARRTGLLDTLNNPSEVLTVFGADNTGFYPDFTLYLNNYDYYLHLKAAMEYQVVSGKALWTGELTTGLEMPTLLQNASVVVTQGTPNPIIVNMGPTVTTGDLLASNGALHITDKVILPPFATTDIIDVIARQPFTFSTLVYLLVLTGLIPELSGEGPFTLFAPTNQAFDDLLASSGILASNDWTSNLATMAEILKYHVVPGVVYAEDLTHNSTWTTLQGTSILVTIGDYYLDRRRHLGVRQLERRLTSFDSNDRELEIHSRPGSVINIDARATLIEKDMLASNGVVHSIDAVLIPTDPSWYESVPSSAPANEVCLQWANFERLCCPISTQAPVVSDRQAQPDNWYCVFLDV